MKPDSEPNEEDEDDTSENDDGDTFVRQNIDEKDDSNYLFNIGGKVLTILLIPSINVRPLAG